jgi:O-antigen/teichoic acid export membrane protein
MGSSASFFGVSVFNYLIFWNSIIILSIFEPSNQVGLLQATLQNSLSLTVVLLIFNSIFPSAASDYYQKSKISKLSQLYNGLSRWALNLSLFGSLYLIIFSREVLLLFGNQFTDAVLVLRILVTGTFLYTGFGLAGQLLLMTDWERLALLNTIIAMVMSVVSNIYLASHYGVMGAAVATSISLAFVGLIQVIEVRRIFEFKPYAHLRWRDIGGISIGSTIAYLASQFITGILPTLVVGGTLMIIPPVVLFIYVDLDEFDQVILETV